MAILIALFFQILFVLFAMAINVGLVVHDKINLQSAADLAAYYGAARQAEILNQISHINYQMRQSYKLLNWRYHGLASMGRRSHPWFEFSGPGDPNNFQSAVCVAHPVWSEFADIAQDTSYCQGLTTIQNIGTLDIPDAVANLINGIVGAFTDIGNQLAAECTTAGFVNWLFATQLLVSHRLDGAARKQMITRLSGALTESQSDFRDISGESVAEGARNTFLNNLTAGNREGSPQMNFFNSMGSGFCAENWLQPINLYALIRYTQVTGSGANCQRVNVPNNTDTLPVPPPGVPLDDVLVSHWRGQVDDQLKSSVGFEKNPWCMAYVGISAQSQGRKIFSPLGNPVTLTARAFAKPFGGRVGPFYGSTWEPGQLQSNDQVKTDPHLPARDTEGSTPPSDQQIDENIINYSQYVGDLGGMAQYDRLQPLLGGLRGTVAQPPNIYRAFQWAQYYHNMQFQEVLSHGDPLARQPEPNVLISGAPQATRQIPFEKAAIAPDAFDITYYSIEPKYHDLYFSGTTVPTHIVPEDERMFDLGSSKDQFPGRPSAYPIRSLIDEVYPGGGSAFFVNPVPNYMVSDWQHLLTGWHQNRATDYSFNEAKFQNCDKPTEEAPIIPTTGACISGGRIGYGVKLVSQDYLTGASLELGGDGASSGALRNPPPPNF